VDQDAARWSYDELDDERRSLRHIESRADDGTYLVAAARGSGEDEARYGVVPVEPLPLPGADWHEMTAVQFAELWRLARCRLDGTAEIAIHEIRPPAGDGLPVVVRCVGGLVQVGSRFDRVRETGEQVALTVARVLVFDRDVAGITPPHTAILILADGGSARIRAGHHLDGRT
jgi:hypothetical protein